MTDGEASAGFASTHREKSRAEEKYPAAKAEDLLSWAEKKGACPLAMASSLLYHAAGAAQDSCLMSCRAVTSTATEGPIVEVT